MKNTTKAFAVLLLIVAATALAACGSGNSVGKKTAQVQISAVKNDVNRINAQLAKLRANEPTPTFNDSAALHVQDAYYTADADPNKIWYATVVALDGTPIAHFTTRGAPQPAGDQVTNPQQLYCQHIGHGTNIPDGCGTIGLPEPNGVHQGTGNEGYIAILTTGRRRTEHHMADESNRDAYMAIGEEGGPEALALVATVMEHNARERDSLMASLYEGEVEAHKLTKARLAAANRRIALIESRLLGLIYDPPTPGELGECP
jgi:hypothetical protein